MPSSFITLKLIPANIQTLKQVEEQKATLELRLKSSIGKDKELENRLTFLHHQNERENQHLENQKQKLKRQYDATIAEVEHRSRKILAGVDQDVNEVETSRSELARHTQTAKKMQELYTQRGNFLQEQDIKTRLRAMPAEEQNNFLSNWNKSLGSTKPDPVFVEAIPADSSTPSATEDETIIVHTKALALQAVTRDADATTGGDSGYGSSRTQTPSLAGNFQSSSHVSQSKYQRKQPESRQELKSNTTKSRKRKRDPVKKTLKLFLQKLSL